LCTRRIANTAILLKPFRGRCLPGRWIFNRPEAVPTGTDVGTIDVTWIDEEDPYVNPMGSKGMGEIGIVGTAAAIANAVYHATGIRIRDLPITLDKLLP